MSDNAKAAEFLRKVKGVVLEELYPYPHDTDVDDRYAWALGQIAGIAVEALDAVATDRKIQGNVEYVRLDEDEFQKLVAGGVVELGRAKIILADIGFGRMLQAVHAAIDASGVAKIR